MAIVKPFKGYRVPGAGSSERGMQRPRSFGGYGGTDLEKNGKDGYISLNCRPGQPVGDFLAGKIGKAGNVRRTGR